MFQSRSFYDPRGPALDKAIEDRFGKHRKAPAGLSTPVLEKNHTDAAILYNP